MHLGLGDISLQSVFLCIIEYVWSSGKVFIKPSESQESMNLKVKCHQITSFENEEEWEKHIEKIGEKFTM